MHLSISYHEIEELVRVKTGKVVTLASSGESQTIAVGCVVEAKIPLLGMVKKEVNAKIKINSISGMSINLSYSFGRGADMLASGAKMLLGEHVEKTGMAVWGDDENSIILFVDKILETVGVDNVDKFTENVSVDNIVVENNGLLVYFSLKF